MYGRYTSAAKEPSIIVSNIVGLLLDSHTHVGATPLLCLTETASVVVVDYHNDVAQV